MLNPTLVWSGFLVLVLSLLALDLFVFQAKAKEISPAAAIKNTLGWVAISLVFNVLVYFIYLGEGFPGGGIEKLDATGAAVRFFTGYLIEKMLSLDNIFVMAAIMAAFRVPKEAQHRVLYWGILGALVLRGTMIGLGTAAIHHFHVLLYPLAALLVITGAKLLFPGKEGDDDGPEAENLAVRMVRKIVPVVRDPDGTKFFTRANGSLAVTPVFLALVSIETSDVLFAIDSVPAVLAVTLDPFLVFSSNVFAILGLRSLYFVLGTMLDKFVYLRQTLSVVLIFVGLKMALSGVFPIDPLISLAIIAAMLTTGVLLSVRKPAAPPVP